MRLKRKKGILYLIADCEGGLAPSRRPCGPGWITFSCGKRIFPRQNILKRARAVKGLCEAYRTPLIINDRADIALLCGADGVPPGRLGHPCGRSPPAFRGGLHHRRHGENRRPGRTGAEKGADYLGSGAFFQNLYKI